ncbi:MAG: resolvase [Gammaproteobacteria bacterium]|nr:resolvase [Gammaproteobacteria bacterium]|tara:strand:+ start:378 stop:989 length:612 start_codon:yes stop_codon:yes gene_type:complete
MNKKAAIYCRVSTNDQKTDMQVRDLRKYAADRNLTIYQEYIDNGISGSIKKRPALDKLMEDASKKRFDIVLCWRFDRFARSSKHLVEALHIFKHLGIDFISFNENIDTSSPLGEAIFTIISAMSQLERDIIRERVKAGLKTARNKGKRLGRPKALVDINKLKEMQSNGDSVRHMANRLDVSTATVSRLLNSNSVTKTPVQSAL